MRTVFPRPLWAGVGGGVCARSARGVRGACRRRTPPPSPAHKGRGNVDQRNVSEEDGFDGADYRVEVGEDLGVGEAEDAVALGFEAVGAEFVLGDGEVVGGAVDFDHEAGAETDEIDDVAGEAVLAAEGVAGDALAPELEPQAGFGGGLVVAEVFDEGVGHGCTGRLYVTILIQPMNNFQVFPRPWWAG